MGGVFEEGGGPDMAPLGKMEPCKRDYEAEIAKAKERQAVTVKLRNAISDYLKMYGRRDSKTFTLPALYGALVLDEEEQIIIIEALQEAWENDK